MKKSVFLGMLAYFFFVATFVLNRSMNLGGGYWLWSAGLCYLFMLPMTWALAGHGLPSVGQLALVEAIQSGEVLFTILGGVLFLGDTLPTMAGCAGIAFIVAGMVANSLAATR